MKKLLHFLSYVPVLLVGILGAYIVFHMWQLTEIGRNHHREPAIGSKQSSDLTGERRRSPTNADPSGSADQP